MPVNLKFFHGPVQEKVNVNSMEKKKVPCDLHGARFTVGTHNVLQCNHQSGGSKDTKTYSPQFKGQ